MEEMPGPRDLVLPGVFVNPTVSSRQLFGPAFAKPNLMGLATRPRAVCNDVNGDVWTGQVGKGERGCRSYILYII